MKIANLFVSCCLILIAFPLNAQVGIGTTSPASSATLDLTSTSGGLLPPRMTIAQRNAIVSPVAGLIIWCSNCTVSGQLQVYNGTNWTNIGDAGIKVGDTYGGGIVAYILQPGDFGFSALQVHGLIAAPTDLSTGAQWGCEGVNIVGAAGVTIGTGNQNTIDIVNGCATAGIAARICYDLVLNGYDDWYLPSKDELNKLYLNQVAIGGFFPDGHYWCSTESTNILAWKEVLNNGYQNDNAKHFPLYVRAIRSF